jgi:hypothetical protein
METEDGDKKNRKESGWGGGSREDSKEERYGKIFLKIGNEGWEGELIGKKEAGGEGMP